MRVPARPSECQADDIQSCARHVGKNDDPLDVVKCIVLPALGFSIDNLGILNGSNIM